MPVIFFLLGLVFGSFFNAVIFRLPRKEYSINKPRRSICPKCKHILSWKDNIPLISYLLLKGKCRYCGAKIPLRYPIVEGLTALLFTKSTPSSNASFAIFPASTGYCFVRDCIRADYFFFHRS